MKPAFLQPTTPRNSGPISRRAALKAGAALAASLAVPPVITAAERRKKVIVAGAGIAGLSCAYELMERGHDVTVLEASRRVGGHVKTIREPLADGLYADVGAEQFPGRPAYSRIWDYVDKFGLTPLRWRRNENVQRKLGTRWYSDAEFADPKVFKQLGFNPREIEFVVQHGMSELSLLYYHPYISKFKDEYQPFGIGLDDLDRQLASDILAKEGASQTAIRFSRMGRQSTPDKPPTRDDASALYRVWLSAILQLRGLRLQPRDLYHLKGGNQTLTDALAAHLGNRIRRHSALSSVSHSGSSVTVRFDANGAKQELVADYLVLCMSPLSLATVTISPGWPAAKAEALKNLTMGMGSRVLLQTRTPFWKGDLPTINLQSGDRRMGSVCETAEDIPGERRLLFGTGQPVQTPEETIAAFREFYPGKARDTIEQCIVHQWWKEEPTCVGCEREPYPLGEMAKIWPHIIEPVGRIHFAGAAYDNHWRGTEAATRSANRVARKIDTA